MWLQIRYFPFLYSSQDWSLSSVTFKSNVYASHESMFLLLQRVIKIFFTLLFSAWMWCIFQGVPLALKLPFQFCLLFLMGGLKGPAFPVWLIQIRKIFHMHLFELSVFFNHWILAWVRFGCGFLACKLWHKTVVLKCGAWPVSFRNLLKVQIFNPISDLLNQKLLVLDLEICVLISSDAHLRTHGIK